MGGAAAGEVASRLAADAFIASLGSEANRSPRVQTRLNLAIQAANQAVFQHSRQSSQLHGMGTTLVALHHPPLGASSSVVWIAHVGDSRCYLLRERHLTLLTADHSLVEEQVRAGTMTPEQASLSPMRNLITRAVGALPQAEPEIQSYPYEPGDIYLLASDGLTRELEDPTVAALLNDIPQPPTEDDLKAACDSLIAAANELGGHDNITVVLVAFPKPSEQQP
jgi:protein phosphatase